jgi:DNA-binding transcriptional ArsR family regulator
LVDSAELFEAISHPMRIRILKILEKHPASFASLKRQLDIDSSGNLDYHLKKLAELVAVREDGLYGLTDAGKEALLSIGAVETWTETERRRTRMLGKMPNEAFFLGLLELCTTAMIFWFFLAIMQVPFSRDSFWGYLFFTALLITGFCSGLGIFLHWEWSWTMVLAKSALIMSMSFFLLDYVWKPGYIVQSSSVAIYYLAFVVAEAAAVIVTLRRPLKEFLGIRREARLPFRAIVGSLLCMSSGILLILLETKTQQPSSIPPSTVFVSMCDPSILCGLLIVIGGVLVLLGSSIPGAASSIIFGLFPPLPYANHVYDIIAAMPTLPYALVIAVLVGSLPIVGGLFALAGSRKIRR